MEGGGGVEGGRRERREAEVSKSRGAEGGWFCPQKVGSGGIARSKFEHRATGRRRRQGGKGDFWIGKEVSF